MADNANNQKTTSRIDDCDLDQVFLASSLLPCASEAFLAVAEPIDSAIKSSDIVLDTNALLLPYGAGPSSVKHIISKYKKLHSEKRLYLPAQVAREFIKNRPNKISELHQGLSDRISKFVSLDEFSYPIFEEVEGYKELNALLKKIKTLKKEISDANANLLKQIRAWEWDDPINSSYKEVFTSEWIIEPGIDKDETLKELLRRNKLSIPPGYKDSTKSDLGIGDFLIWKTILSIGEKNKKNLIFVSGDEKADWQHRTGGMGFLPRYELLDEYRRISGGKAFYITPLSKLLELLSVDTSSVQEIKQEEERIIEANTVIVDCPHCASVIAWRLEDHPGASATPRCGNCGKAFHIHRTKDGVTVHRPNERTQKQIDNQPETVSCPVCENSVEADLATHHNATTWCHCDMCNSTFAIHRKRDGGVKLGGLSRSCDG